jgi:transposase
MPKAISVEVRERVVAAHREGKGTYEELAEVFRIGRATVNRWLRLARETGSLAPKPPPGRAPKLDEKGRAVLRALVEEDSDATLAELAERVEQRVGVKLVASAIFKVLAKMQITHKKKTSTRPNGTATTFCS